MTETNWPGPGRREIVTKRWETEVGHLTAIEHNPNNDTVEVRSSFNSSFLLCKKSDLIALAELLKQEKS